MEEKEERGGEATLGRKPLLLIIGAGGTGRELLMRVLPHWRISIVEKDPKAAARIRKDFGSSATLDSECTVWEGDASSPLVLEEARIQEAEIVAITTSDDRLNREVCRIATERYERKRVLSLIQEDRNLALSADAPVEWVHRHRILAGLLEQKIQAGVRGNVLLESEGGQILETKVTAGSPVVGRSLDELNAQTWRVAAVFRDKALILPEPNTRLQAEDRVLLVGHPEVLRTIAEYVRIGISEFPRRYGQWLLMPVFCEPQPKGLLEEALYLAKNTKVQGVQLFCWAKEAQGEQEKFAKEFRSAGLSVRTTAYREDPVDTLLEAAKNEDIGCLVLPPSSWRSTPRTIGRIQFRRLLEAVDCPILVARGTHPYQRILVPVTDKAESIASAELAMDLARLLGSRTSAASIMPPSFSVGEAELRSQKEALEKTLSLGNLYRMSIEGLEKEGNPIREILKLVRRFNLLVVSHRRGRGWRLFRPDISHHLIGKASSSVLVVEMGKAVR